VFYPFHPRAGEHIFVVGARSHRDENCYVIALENGKSELIPEWMTKSDAQNMSIISTPTIKLVERAKELGWQEGMVKVIDRDLGTSASGCAERKGFQELLSYEQLSKK